MSLGTVFYCFFNGRQGGWRGVQSLQIVRIVRIIEVWESSVCIM